eukprot:10694052-Lingulodinium_polyedra.AAC.1
MRCSDPASPAPQRGQRSCVLADQSPFQHPAASAAARKPSSAETSGAARSCSATCVARIGRH